MAIEKVFVVNNTSVIQDEVFRAPAGPGAHPRRPARVRVPRGLGPAHGAEHHRVQDACAVPPRKGRRRVRPGRARERVGVHRRPEGRPRAGAAARGGDQVHVLRAGAGRVPRARPWRRRKAGRTRGRARATPPRCPRCTTTSCSPRWWPGRRSSSRRTASRGWARTTLSSRRWARRGTAWSPRWSSWRRSSARTRTCSCGSATRHRGHKCYAVSGSGAKRTVEVREERGCDLCVERVRELRRRAWMGGQDRSAEEEGPLHIHSGEHGAAATGRARERSHQGARVQVPERALHALTIQRRGIRASSGRRFLAM